MKDLINLKRTTSNFYISIKTAEIPYSFFSLTSSFNVLVIKVDGIDYPLTIPPGNYNAINLNTVLDALIQPYIIHGTYTTTYNRSTGKNTIAITGYDNVPFTLEIKWDLNLELGAFFGYTLRTTITATIGIVYSNEVSDLYADCGQIQALFLRSDSLSQSGNYECLTGIMTTSTIVQKIIVTTPPNSIIFYQNDLFNSVKIMNKSISYLDFYITTNRSATPVDFNGLNWSFRLSVDEMDTIVSLPVNPKDKLEASEKENSMENTLYNEIMNS